MMRFYDYLISLGLAAIVVACACAFVYVIHAQDLACSARPSAGRVYAGRG
jgi:hypothetical protein